MAQRKIIKRSINSPDEVREFPDGSGSLRVLSLGEHVMGYVTFNPGWRWSKSVKPIAGTETCQVEHVLYVVSGRMAVKMDDGSQTEIGPGDATHIPPGHDAWIVGNEPFVGVDFTGAPAYAKRK